MEGVAAPVRSKAGSLIDALYRAGYEFDFYQAVALLHALRPDAVTVGEGAEPAAEPVRFESKVDLRFPATDVSDVEPPAAPGEPARVRVAFMGLAGALGPLPNTVTEVVLERQQRKDHAFRAFLDLFNHRLVSLQYRIRAEHRPGLAKQTPPDSRVARYLFALIGLGTPRLRGRMGIADRGLLAHAPVLGGQLRSVSGLETLLAQQFGVPVSVRAFLGRWLPLPADAVTILGRHGQNRLLGRDAVAGQRVWDQQSQFLVVLGPLSLAEFLAFLPVHDRFRPLVAVTRFYAGEELDFEFELRLRPEEIPPATASVHMGSLLGWTSWLGRPPAAAGNGQGTDGSAFRPEVGVIRLSGGARDRMRDWAQNSTQEQAA